LILAETFLSPFVDFRVTVVEAPLTAFLGALITTFLPLTLAVATFLEAVVAVTTAAFVAGLAAVAVNPTLTVLPGATTTVF
jgi:sterol desaturase/sphingolipid hydroxylase (fatty acid hydroxylase superfamily)